MKRVRVGIAVGENGVRLVAVRGRRVAVAAAAELDGGDELEEVVAGLLRQAGLPRLPQPRATLVLGPARGQLRALSGLPETPNPALLAEAVRQEPGRFFLRNGSPLLTTGLRPTAPGEAWAGALDESVVRGVQRACAAAGVRLDAAAPLAVALAGQLPDGTYTWPDGPVAAEVQVEGGAVASVRRRPAAPGEAAALPAPPALAPVGPDAAWYLDAYAAAMLPAREPVAVRFASGDVSRWRIGVAAAALVLVLGLAMVMPARRARAVERAAAAELERTSEARRAAQAEARDLGEVTQALQEVASFAEGRRSAVELVAGLSRVLPPGSVLVSVRADSAGGQLAVLAPRAADVLAALDSLPLLTGPAITGPVTRESVQGSPVERVAIRFGWAGGAP